MVSSGIVHAVLHEVGFRLAAEVRGHRLYECVADGAETEYLVLRLDEDVPEEALVDALENAGIARDAIHEALRQCGL